MQQNLHFSPFTLSFLIIMNGLSCLYLFFSAMMAMRISCIRALDLKTKYHIAVQRIFVDNQQTFGQIRFFKIQSLIIDVAEVEERIFISERCAPFYNGTYCIYCGSYRYNTVQSGQVQSSSANKAMIVSEFVEPCAAMSRRLLRCTSITVIHQDAGIALDIWVHHSLVQSSQTKANLVLLIKQ